jgi:hypothetical protein
LRVCWREIEKATVKIEFSKNLVQSRFLFGRGQGCDQKNVTRHAQEAVSRKLHIPSSRSRECCAFLLELTLTQLSIARGSSWRVSWKRENKKMAVQIQSPKSQVCKMFWQSADCLRERGT